MFTVDRCDDDVIGSCAMLKTNSIIRALAFGIAFTFSAGALAHAQEAEAPAAAKKEKKSTKKGKKDEKGGEEGAAAGAEKKEGKKEEKKEEKKPGGGW